ncbi:MAG: hypothetical protein LBR69_02400 [Endomicrobium sp.]|jgi:O-antigen ligase|nr:hypothetical protein [Endomicrobium sp.]
MENQSEKFNYTVLILALGLIISVFSHFGMTPGIYYGVFILFFSSFCYVVLERGRKPGKSCLPVFLFLAFAVFLYYASDFKYGLRYGILLLSSSSAAYFLSACLNEYEKRSVMLVPVLIALWLTIYLFASTFAVSQPARAAALPPVSCFLVAALALSFIFWRPDRKIYYFTSLMIFCAVIMTKHDFASFTACIVSALFLFFIRKDIKIKTVFTVTPFIAAAAFFFYKLLQNSFFAGQRGLWNAAMPAIKDNFIFGTGFGSYESVILYYSGVSSGGNLFLRLFVETGITGFAAFFGIIAVFFYFMIKKLKTAKDKVLWFSVFTAVCAVLFLNFFESSLFYITNAAVFFILLSFPLDFPELKTRANRINPYIAVLFLAFLIFSAAKPLYADRQYKEGISFFAAEKYPVSLDYYFKALQNDALNPEYSSRIADTYFAMYSQSGDKTFLNNAAGYALFASQLNKYSGKYYYQLAWFYKFKNDDDSALEYMEKAIEADKFNEMYQDSYGDFL